MLLLFVPPEEAKRILMCRLKGPFCIRINEGLVSFLPSEPWKIAWLLLLEAFYSGVLQRACGLPGDHSVLICFAALQGTERPELRARPWKYSEICYFKIGSPTPS